MTAQCRSVVETGGKEVHLVGIRLVDQPVLLADSPRPFAAELRAQRFRLARPGERIPERRFNKPERSQRSSPVRACPVFKILKEMWIHYRLTRFLAHPLASPKLSNRSVISSVSPSPAAARWLASSKRFALFGERRR